MSNDKKNRILDIIGTLLLLVGSFALIVSSVRGSYEQIFWFCYLSLIVIGVGVLSRNPVTILSQLNIIVIPSLFWIIDFLYYLINGKGLLGIVNYFFVENSILVKIISLQHVFTIFLAVYALYLIKIDFSKKIWIISFLQMAIFFVLTFLLTSYESNINCVFHSCGNLFSNVQYYPFFWFEIALVIILATELIVTSLPFIKKK